MVLPSAIYGRVEVELPTARFFVPKRTDDHFQRLSVIVVFPVRVRGLAIGARDGRAPMGLLFWGRQPTAVQIAAASSSGSAAAKLTDLAEANSVSPG
jgi:hypothetical protein